MNKFKAKIVVVLMFILLCVLCADVVALVPKALPWLLGVLAIPGGWLFCKVLYAWLIDDDAPMPKLEVPVRKKKGKGYVDFTKLWAGVPEDEE